MADPAAEGPYLARIDRFPIKSLDGQTLTRSRVTAAGALVGDRRWKLVDRLGRTVNAKRDRAIHRIRATYDAALTTVELRWQDDGTAPDLPPVTYSLDRDRDAIAQWCGRALGQSLTLVEDRDRGFPDDPNFWGPTLVSTGTLTAVARWFPELSLDTLRARMRTNLEIDGVSSFWEDRLAGAAAGGPNDSAGIAIAIGEVSLLGCNPCKRCVVPSRDPVSGDPLPEFARTFAQRRQAELPSFAPRSRFNGFYRLAVNTRIPPSDRDRTLQVGDALQMTPGDC